MILFSLIALSCFCDLLLTLSAPILDVKQGKLFGTYYIPSNGKPIYAFYGIPYALPPVSKYRFKEPHSLKSWNGIWNATFYRNQCIQYNHYSYSTVGEEDCLYLNIFTPKLPKNGEIKLMNVIVYIHGGAFMFGSGNDIYPDFLMKKEDIVFVTFNYRVGPLGFFSTDDCVVPGNNGLKDQVFALKWIKENIASFGGNPSSVTIMGTSSGGASVHYHYISPLSRGLFHRGISFSGTVFAPWTLPKDVFSISLKLARLLNCGGLSTVAMIECLKEVSAYDMLEVVKTFMPWRYSPFTVFGPVIERPHVNAFLNSDPLELMLNGKIADLPWLVTTAEHEGLYPVADFLPHEVLIKELNDNWSQLSPLLFQYNDIKCSKEKENVTYAVKQFYFQDKDISRNTAKQLIQVAGDRLFYVPMRNAIKFQALMNSSPVYCYKFNYRGRYSLSNIFTKNYDNYGVSHADDLQYVLKVYYGNPEQSETDKAMVNTMTELVSSFIRYGKPFMNNATWNAVTINQIENMDHLNCLKINSASDQTMFNFEDEKADHFWNSLFPITANYKHNYMNRYFDEF